MTLALLKIKSDENYCFFIVHFYYKQIPCFPANDSIKIDQRDYNRRNNYPLPPGPSSISGTLVDQYGNPIQGANVTVKYPDGKQRPVDTFTSNEWGIFSVSVFRYDQPYIDLEIKVGKKVSKTIRYMNPGRGKNLGHYTQKIVCPVKKKKSKEKRHKK